MTTAMAQAIATGLLALGLVMVALWIAAKKARHRGEC